MGRDPPKVSFTTQTLSWALASSRLRSAVTTLPSFFT